MDPPFSFFSCLAVRFGWTKKLYDPWLPFCILGYLVLSFIAVQRLSLSLFFLFFSSFILFSDILLQCDVTRRNKNMSWRTRCYSSVRPSTFNEISSNHGFRVCHCSTLSPNSTVGLCVCMCTTKHLVSCFSSYIVPFYLFFHVNWIKNWLFFVVVLRKSLIFRVNC